MPAIAKYLILIFMKTLKTLALAVPLLLLSAPVSAQDISGDPLRGQALMVEMKCPKCHGDTGLGRSKTPGVPRIDGQFATYLENQLRNFRDGMRPHKFMEVYAGRLDGQTIRDLAAFYACQGPGTPLTSDPSVCDPVR